MSKIIYCFDVLVSNILLIEMNEGVIYVSEYFVWGVNFYLCGFFKLRKRVKSFFCFKKI